MQAILALEDGRYFMGRSFGAIGERTGEVVFNTSMWGYQEILTDPSYKGQILVMTYPEIGNCGINDTDRESASPKVEGFVIREMSEIHSNWRSGKDLNQYLKENGIVGISEVDTRAITKHIRSKGVMKGIISTLDKNIDSLIRKAKNAASLKDEDLVRKVSCSTPFSWSGGREEEWASGIKRPSDERAYHIVAYDFGIKLNIKRCLHDSGMRVTVVPAWTNAEEVIALQPDGLFLSNGPGDPAVVDYAIVQIGKLIGKLPIFGICLGHQILGLAFGGKTFKLKFGHRGGNQPVMNLLTGRVEITAQNHGYAVDATSLPTWIEITHINLNDETVEGMRHRELPIFSVQYHPESSPGPHDSLYLFEYFSAILNAFHKSKASEIRTL
ncbi:MAG: glutamine-hydrolyzing carbamoyl-phosphate synthase small subunit [Acidobacteriota bacterium]